MRRPLLIGLIFVQLLLMGAAFVGGRMLGQQNARANRTPGSAQLPSQLPKDPVAGTGSVAQVRDTVITLARGRAPSGGTASTQTEITVTADTKYYKSASTGVQAMPGGVGATQVQLQVQDATLADVKVGSTILVWGPKNGERVHRAIKVYPRIYANPREGKNPLA
ncbi:MAG: hypothetical protein HY782_09995 [Chloroflexi bacterium]|nr:hypothetical protein [Chloroflexota bacterium]